MILAISDIVTVPFGWVLAQLNRYVGYGWALILFAIIVKLVLTPMTAKAKKSSMKMSRLSPQIKLLQEKYADDPQRQSAEMQALYKREGVSLGGSCLWSLLPLLILIPLYQVIRQPIQFMLGETPEMTAQIIAKLKELAPTAFTANNFYEQLEAAPLIPQFAEELKAAFPNLSAQTLQGLNFSFLGVDLGAIPTYNVLNLSWWTWANIGAFLIPVLSAGSQLLSMVIAQKMNGSVVADDNGIRDEEAAKQSQAAQQGKMMMWVMPIMSLLFGFSMPAAISLYWFAQGIASLVSDVLLTQHYRKIYDAEDAVKLERLRQQQALEAEKEAIRAARRAENPDGITQNTSKKKIQQQKQKEAEEQKAAAAKEYAKKKGEAVAEEPAEKATVSGVKDRPYCKGRAYDPNRYSNPEE